MFRGLLRLSRAVFARPRPATLTEPASPPPSRPRMKRRPLTAAVALLLVGSAGGLYWKFVSGGAPPDAPEFTAQPLAPAEEFEKLAREDPVAALAQCLSRYQREGRGGLRATLEKQERVRGKPAPPEAPPVELIELSLRGDVPDPETHRTAIEVLMKWRAGAKSFLGSDIRATLFSERPKAEGGLDGKVVTWRPDARFQKESFAVPPNNDLAKGQSRFCIRDAGLYRSMLRTHEAWKARRAAGEFRFDYLGKQTHPKLGRECFVIRRLCPRVEVDAFELGGTATGDPQHEGFTEVTVYIDAERWLQIGSELYRTGAGDSRVLIGAYYFRDVQLNPTFAADTFTTAEMRR